MQRLGEGLQVDGLTRLMLGGQQEGDGALPKNHNRRETWCPGAIGLPRMPTPPSKAPFHPGFPRLDAG
jgi:hypothetical protein